MPVVRSILCIDVRCAPTTKLHQWQRDGEKKKRISQYIYIYYFFLLLSMKKRKDDSGRNTSSILFSTFLHYCAQQFGKPVFLFFLLFSFVSGRKPHLHVAIHIWSDVLLFTCMMSSTIDYKIKKKTEKYKWEEKKTRTRRVLPWPWQTYNNRAVKRKILTHDWKKNIRADFSVKTTQILFNSNSFAPFLRVNALILFGIFFSFEIYV